ncbi:MAG: YdcF family protein [Flavobacteriales bacterium]|nr:YdcF family protein [Flavobacteriales bacterium]
MFYTLSKALLFLIQPTTWLLIIIILSFYSRSRIRRKRLRVIALALFVIFGNAFLFDQVVYRLEAEPIDLSKERYRYGVLLGGYGEHNSQSDALELFRAADRLTTAIELLEGGQIQELILSSGVHEYGRAHQNEARLTYDMLVRMGVDAERLIIEDRSWNTYQNALMSREIIGPSTEPVVLITSAFHMPRAKACFEKQGLEVIPYAVDFIYDDEPKSWSYYVIPSIQVMIEWQIILKEAVGGVVYALRGYC